MTLSSPFLSYKDYNDFSPIDISVRRNLNDDDLWKTIRNDYLLKKEYVNLENGYYCFIPQPTLNKHINQIKRINLEGSYYMRNDLNKNNIILNHCIHHHNLINTY